MSRRGGAVVALLALAGALACGNKTSVRPPELVKPRAAVSLAAHPVKDGVHLTWRKPVEYTGGGRMNDLGGFEIERAPAGSGSFDKIFELVLDEQQRYRQNRLVEWTDTSAVPGTRYRYRVTAFTLDGYQSAPSNVAEVTPGNGDGAQVDHPGPGQ